MEYIVDLKNVKDFWVRKVRGKWFQQVKDRKGSVDKYFDVDDWGIVTKGKFWRNEDGGLW